MKCPICEKSLSPLPLVDILDKEYVIYPCEDDQITLNEDGEILEKGANLHGL